MEKVMPILEAIRELSPYEAMLAACMAVDIAAHKNDTTPPEMLKELSPIIEEVFKEYKFDGV